jgi:cytochrome c oxidase subunit 4
LTIAALKGTLVVLVFMHLLEIPRVSWLALGIGIFWLGILIGLTLTDYLTRHWLVF